MFHDGFQFLKRFWLEESINVAFVSGRPIDEVLFGAGCLEFFFGGGGVEHRLIVA